MTLSMKFTLLQIGQITEMLFFVLKSKQPIRTRYLGQVTGYQPISDQYFLIRSVPAFQDCITCEVMWMVSLLLETTLSGEREGSLLEIPDWNARFGGDRARVVVLLVGMVSSFAGPVGLVVGWQASSVGASGVQTGEKSKQPIRTRYLGQVTGYQPISDQYFLIRSVPAFQDCITCDRARVVVLLVGMVSSFAGPVGLVVGWQASSVGASGVQTGEKSKQPIRTRYLGQVTGYQPISDQYLLIRSVPAFQDSITCTLRVEPISSFQD
eukprot:sb/3468254/